MSKNIISDNENQIKNEQKFEKTSDNIAVQDSTNIANIEEIKNNEIVSIDIKNLAVNSDKIDNQNDNKEIATNIMQLNKEEIRQYEAEQQIDYIKQQVENGIYFKDALNWYLFRYVSPVCERAMLIFCGIISFFVMTWLYSMLQNAFPTTKQKPIIIESYNQAEQHIYLENLKPHAKSIIDRDKVDPQITTIDDGVAKKLVEFYVKEREGYDYSDGDVNRIKKKFNKIRNNSSADEYAKFQSIMSSENPDSPVYNLGKMVKKNIAIKYIKLIKPQKLLLKDKIIGIVKDPIPNEAEVIFDATTKITNEDITETNKQGFKAILKFDFSGTANSEKLAFKDNFGSNEGRELKFIVKQYQLFKIKQ